MMLLNVRNVRQDDNNVKIFHLIFIIISFNGMVFDRENIDTVSVIHAPKVSIVIMMTIVRRTAQDQSDDKVSIDGHNRAKKSNL